MAEIVFIMASVLLRYQVRLARPEEALEALVDMVLTLTETLSLKVIKRPSLKLHFERLLKLIAAGGFIMLPLRLALLSIGIPVDCIHGRLS